MRAFLEAETYEGLHHGSCAIGARPETLPAFLRQSTGLDIDVLAADRALQHLECRVVRTGPLLNHDRNVVHVARSLQPVIKGQDGLRRNSRAQSCHLAAARATLQAVNACPLANVVAVCRAALEKLFFEPAENRLSGDIPFAVRVARREADIEACFGKQSF